MRELYISIDIESDGPAPGLNSMLSLGAVALFADETIVGEFDYNLEPLEGAQGDPDTLEWWSKQPKTAQEACRRDPKPPGQVMKEFHNWVSALVEEYSAIPVAVAYPACFDYMWVHWYMVKFGLPDLFRFSCIDTASYAMRALRLPYRDAKKRNMPIEWFKGLSEHDHVAVNDARSQGLIFVRMLKHASP